MPPQNAEKAIFLRSSKKRRLRKIAFSAFCPVIFSVIYNHFIVNKISKPTLQKKAVSLCINPVTSARYKSRLMYRPDPGLQRKETTPSRLPQSAPPDTFCPKSCLFQPKTASADTIAGKMCLVVRRREDEQS
ncbi:MAG: hypothetical protein J6Y27_00185 [Bacteroidales bacterium]|nr:hypothetical protein [Bacteroidales bacterium]